MPSAATSTGGDGYRLGESSELKRIEEIVKGENEVFTNSTQRKTFGQLLAMFASLPSPDENGNQSAIVSGQTGVQLRELAGSQLAFLVNQFSAKHPKRSFRLHPNDLANRQVALKLELFVRNAELEVIIVVCVLGIHCFSPSLKRSAIC